MRAVTVYEVWPYFYFLLSFRLVEDALLERGSMMRSVAGASSAVQITRVVCGENLSNAVICGIGKISSVKGAPNC
ncbi:hypothetical protein D5366_09110 [Neokomagataea tanensis]|uniref:Uncharacterized protein n=1 Tax=Neokomagataea tanensis TaxID=661191 RepID=A0A4Y6V5Y4_9PROT|nr:hypothetical protein D5366_09110 [Neokomagataea tanensis]